MCKPSRYILLLLAILTAISCRKEKRINTYDPGLTLTQKYTHMMSGARGWTAVMNQDDSTFELNDIAFKIDIINDTTIRVFSDTLTYMADDTANSLFYVKSTIYEFCSLRYFYKRDSIEFFKSQNIGSQVVSYIYNTYPTGL